MGSEFSFEIRFAVSRARAEMLEHELASGENPERLALAALRALGGLLAAEGEVETRSVTLSSLPPSSSDLSQSHPPASRLEPLSRWTFDTSGIEVNSSDSVQVYNRLSKTVTKERGEIEITDEMISAGVEELRSTDKESIEPEHMVAYIYRVMAMAAEGYCKTGK